MQALDASQKMSEKYFNFLFSEAESVPDSFFVYIFGCACSDELHLDDEASIHLEERVES
jgi:hypothetical protein